jgi:putative inorganic carbon (HCO3(-)) transporter
VIFNGNSSFSKLSKLSNAYKLMWLLFAVLLFFTPLVVSSLTEESFEFPKMFFVYFLGVTLVFVFAIEYILRPIKLKWPNYWVLAYIAAIALSTLFSSHLYTSVWGYYSRFHGGLTSVLVLFGIYFVGANAFKKFGEAGIKRLMLAPVISLFLISAFALIQHFSFEAGERVYSTFGQPNWLAAYVVMTMPLVLYFAFEKGVSWPFRQFLGVAFVLAYAALWYTFSLSGLVGLMAGLAVFAWLNWKNIKKNRGWLVVVFGICVLISLLSPKVYGHRFNDVYQDLKKITINVSVVHAHESNSENHSPTPSAGQISDPWFIRSALWKGTINLVTSSPKIIIIGTGPETFPYQFQLHRPTQLNYSSEWDFIMNKPHNFYLELISESGLIGLVAYLGIIVWSIRKRHAYATPALAAFYVTNFFGFPVVTTALMFWVFLALLETDS